MVGPAHPTTTSKQEGGVSEYHQIEITLQATSEEADELHEWIAWQVCLGRAEWWRRPLMRITGKHCGAKCGWMFVVSRPFFPEDAA